MDCDGRRCKIRLVPGRAKVLYEVHPKAYGEDKGTERCRSNIPKDNNERPREHKPEEKKTMKKEGRL